MSYRYRVEHDDGPNKFEKDYDGTDVADAMAALSKAISDGGEYILFEALREAGT